MLSAKTAGELGVNRFKMISTAKQILEQYVLGKDKDLYQILETIFAESAEVEFEIRSEKISFPETITGNQDIASILSKDFNKKYESVKTYYLTDVEQHSQKIDNQIWLVVMKEIGREVTRVGTGYYNWEFHKTERGLKVSKLKIYIHEMLELVDFKSTILSEIQSKIAYPWPDIISVRQALIPFRDLSVVSEYIDKNSR